jgi:hypothetical protein
MMEEKGGTKRDRDGVGKAMNTKRLPGVFVLLLTILVIIDFFVHRHGHLPLENLPEFFPIYGFVSVVLMAIVTRLLRLFIKKDESYYE